MKALIVDSCVWNAAFHKRDNHHEKGRKFLEWFNNRNDIKVYINDYIISETLAFLRRKLTKRVDITNKIINMFLTDERIEVFYTSKENFNLAIDIFRQYDKLSLVDSIIVLNYLKTEPICLISYDEGFDTYTKITRLEDPNNID
ncbi:hypothetical protein LCGC14_1117730 [marine sediment metagenome]|uniref:PIN domain-containing protein n=1 Tax=marine sediment metagenome TaxID=412755 RepID=A0A0F9M4V0_9ZZZZ